MTKILTIDSEEAVVERIVKILESNDYRALRATTWTEAVDAIAYGQPDLILLNIEMPVIHGDILIEFIREEGFEMPVILVSFPVEEGVGKALREQGVHSIVEKPFEDRTLIEEIERVFNRARFKEDTDPPAETEETEVVENASEESSEATEVEEAPAESTSDEDEDEDESEPSLEQPRDLEAPPRKMSKRNKMIMFIIFGIYVLIGGFIFAMYFTDAVPAFVGQMLQNW